MNGEYFASPNVVRPKRKRRTRRKKGLRRHLYNTARQAAARVLRDIAPQQREYGREAVGESHARPELGEHDAAHPYPRAELERLD